MSQEMITDTNNNKDLFLEAHRASWTDNMSQTARSLIDEKTGGLLSRNYSIIAVFGEHSKKPTDQSTAQILNKNEATAFLNVLKTIDGQKGRNREYFIYPSAFSVQKGWDGESIIKAGQITEDLLGFTVLAKNLTDVKDLPLAE